MLSRKIIKELKTTAKEYPVVTIIGPRQSGKTTLARNLFHDHTYVNLENPELRSLASEDPKTFMLRYPIPVILDEIPKVFKGHSVFSETVQVKSTRHVNL